MEKSSPYKTRVEKQTKKTQNTNQKNRDLYNYSYLIVLLCARVKEGEWSGSSRKITSGCQNVEQDSGLRKINMWPQIFE